MSVVVIVGAGIAGLTCAQELHARNIACTILEASDAVGGRARTDVVEGFLLDRGFQVLLTAYPEAQRLLDYNALKLNAFAPGALIWHAGKLHPAMDPWKRPQAAVATMLSPIGSLSDKMKVAALRRQVTRRPSEEVLSAPEKTTLEYLQDFGFSELMIERFFRPFLAGVFLEPELTTSSRMFEFVFRMFSLGAAALPAKGMGAIAEQLASGLLPHTIRLGASVAKINNNSVQLSTGELLPAKAVIVATDQRGASTLLPEIMGGPNRRTSCFYFAATVPPIKEPLLMLNGENAGPINNLTVPSLIARTYAPMNSHLISVSVVGDAASHGDLERDVRVQLRSWFGSTTDRWRLLRRYDIEYALPEVPAGVPAHRTRSVRKGVFVCGDHCENASINGAMSSGSAVAEQVSKYLA